MIRNPISYTDIQRAVPTASIMRVGAPEESFDVVLDGERLYGTEIGPTDDSVAQLAGWNRFQQVQVEGDPTVRCMVVPMSARSAESVLSGTQAWQTEKQDVVNALGSYVAGLAGSGLIDTDIQLRKMVVDRSGAAPVFLPPHKLVQNPDTGTVRKVLGAVNDQIAAVVEPSERSGLTATLTQRVRSAWRISE